MHQTPCELVFGIPWVYVLTWTWTFWLIYPLAWCALGSSRWLGFFWDSSKVREKRPWEWLVSTDMKSGFVVSQFFEIVPPKLTNVHWKIKLISGEGRLLVTVELSKMVFVRDPVPEANLNVFLPQMDCRWCSMLRMQYISMRWSNKTRVCFELQGHIQYKATWYTHNLIYDTDTTIDGWYLALLMIWYGY